MTWEKRLQVSIFGGPNAVNCTINIVDYDCTLAMTKTRPISDGGRNGNPHMVH